MMIISDETPAFIALTMQFPDVISHFPIGITFKVNNPQTTQVVPPVSSIMLQAEGSSVGFYVCR